jgi:hypothetical protein
MDPWGKAKREIYQQEIMAYINFSDVSSIISYELEIYKQA